MRRELISLITKWAQPKLCRDIDLTIRAQHRLTSSTSDRFIVNRRKVESFLQGSEHTSNGNNNSCRFKSWVRPGIPTQTNPIAIFYFLNTHSLLFFIYLLIFCFIYSSVLLFVLSFLWIIYYWNKNIRIRRTRRTNIRC